MVNMIFSKEYKSIRIAAYIFATIVAFVLFHKKELPLIQSQTANPLCVSQACKNQADINYQQALEAIRKEFNIPMQAWHNAHDEFLAVCQANQDLFAWHPKRVAVKDELKNLVRTALAGAGINPDKVSIEYTADKSMPVVTYQEYTAADRLKHSITINKEWFSTHPIELQRAIINHEIMHLKNFDCIEYGFITQVLEQHGIAVERYEKSASMQNFRHMRELRADLLAGSGDVNIAKALHQDFCNCVARDYQEDVHSHPSSQTRLDQMAQLLNKMEIEAPIKLG